MKPVIDIPYNVTSLPNNHNFSPPHVLQQENESDQNAVALLARSVMMASSKVLFSIPIRLRPTGRLSRASREHWAVLAKFADRAPALLRVALFISGHHRRKCVSSLSYVCTCY